MDLIPITERLPEAEVNVLIYNAVGYYAVGYVNKNGHWAANINGRETEVSMTTHWAPLPELPKKKRWMPSENDQIWRITISGGLETIEYHAYNSIYRDYLGVYKSRGHAQEMADAIKAFITEKIGEV